VIGSFADEINDARDIERVGRASSHKVNFEKRMRAAFRLYHHRRSQQAEIAACLHSLQNLRGQQRTPTWQKAKEDGFIIRDERS
jgi:hypothetical protein